MRSIQEMVAAGDVEFGSDADGDFFTFVEANLTQQELDLVVRYFNDATPL